MRKRIENISSLIESWCKKKIIFARLLLPFGTVRKASTHCTHAEGKSARVQFLPSHYALLKIGVLLILMFTSSSNYAQDSYITTVDLNLRSGAGKNYKSITVLAKGDTVKLLDNSGDYWAKIQYQDKIGYSAIQYIQKIQIIEKVEIEGDTESGNGFLIFLICLSIIISTAILLKKTGDKYRYKSTATVLSFFFGAFGFQKFYLGEKKKGIYSILFCWTSIPILVGIIDFLKYTFMKEQIFMNRYNQNKKSVQRKKSNKNPQKKTHIKRQSTIDSQLYIIKLYQKGLYLNEILDSARDVRLKMPNGEDILHTQQVISIIRSKIPNATFEIKSNNTPKQKPILPLKNVEKLVEHNNNKPTQSVKKDLEILDFAKKSYPNELEMQEYVYNEQIESKKFMLTTTDEDLIEYSKSKYPDDYSLQEYIYKEQVKAKAFMKKTSNVEVKQFVLSEYPDDYSMQEYIYNLLVALPEDERAIIEVDGTIIDINSENLDLSVEQSTDDNEPHRQPPYWGHTYVYSYDEIRHATKAQKQFYTYFKNEVANGEYIDIQGNTNYAFILYFDLLNEYENHRDIKLLEEQFKLLGKICPKTKSYSLMSTQDLLRKRTDSYSVDKLTNLQEPNYQVEHGYSDYDPDAYKLGKQYKDKLELNKQEVAWLNKFWNPSNVFISIEGSCIATMKQYLLIIKSLNKKLKIQNTSVAKEVDFFKEKIFEIKEIADSHWGVYDKSYLKQRVESEIYLAIFKRVENSVRESFGHKRKVGSTPYYDFKGEFETRIGNYVDELVLKYQNDIEHPDLETQIELNAQNVNRWKIHFNNLKNSFQKEDKIKFIDGVTNLEETNQKNRNIENIFFEASKFISKFDNVQSLKYYAKYIYYDLKSKKFDNKELTKTVQKSLFKTEEQINDFKIIIAELIDSSDIKKALDEIAKIYIPKRKKIKLDKSVIKEVEQRHDGTVKLLSGYLETENKETVESEIENEEIGISVIPTNTNNTIFISEISIGKIQEELIKKIVSNSFEIHQKEVDKFAIENGFFKNQLIDSINEACEEYLEGEALIEEDDENYVIEESYYKELAV